MVNASVLNVWSLYLVNLCLMRATIPSAEFPHSAQYTLQKKLSLQVPGTTLSMPPMILHDKSVKNNYIDYLEQLK